jgi:hypothetical protein
MKKFLTSTFLIISTLSVTAGCTASKQKAENNLSGHDFIKQCKNIMVEQTDSPPDRQSPVSPNLTNSDSTEDFSDISDIKAWSNCHDFSDLDDDLLNKEAEEDKEFVMELNSKKAIGDSSLLRLSLRRARRAQSLNLTNSDLKRKEFSILGEALRVFYNLKKIDLSNNQFGKLLEGEVEELFFFVKELKTLNSIDLSNNYLPLMPLSACEKLFDLILENRDEIYLRLNNNHLFRPYPSDAPPSGFFKVLIKRGFVKVEDKEGMLYLYQNKSKTY